MIHFNITQRVFHFRQPAATSRGVYTTRKSWFVEAFHREPSQGETPSFKGVGECAPLPALSCDDLPDYASVLRRFCTDFEQRGTVDLEVLRPYPSMLFGVETALLHLQRRSLQLFDTPFSRGEAGIPINGLVWMGSFEQMAERLEEKLRQGFGCVKLKIGAISFDRELELIRLIRQRFSAADVQLRVDANGAFTPEEAPEKLQRLAAYHIHSIEQPIRAGQISQLASLCRESPIPIALDEELIGHNTVEAKMQLLQTVRPQYVVLKPSLHGGMAGTREWVRLAAGLGIGSWITSALESNVGLNAISQLTAHIYGPDITMAQGLGTGQLFTDNIPMPLRIEADQLRFSLA